MLQGTASVYSKKIEFLWKQVSDMLEMLRNKKNDEAGEGEEGAGGPGGSRGRRKNNEMTREFEYLNTDIGKNLNMKTGEDEGEKVKERKDALNFIYITPRQLVEKEGSEQKAVKVNMYTGVQHSKWDLLAAKEDFRINSQYVLLTGYLGEDLNVDNVYLNLVTEETVGDQTEVEVEPEPSGHLETTETMGEGNNFPDEAPPDPEPALDDSVVSERAAGQNLSGGERDLLVSPPPPACQPVSPASPPPLSPRPTVDTWQPLDPHQELRTPKPIKVKPTRRLPPSLRKNKKASVSPIMPISEYLNQEMNPTANQMKFMPYVPLSCYDLAAQERERRRVLEREQRKTRVEERGDLRRQIFDDEEEKEEFDEVDNDGPGDEDDGNGFDDNFEDFHLPDPHLGGDLGAIAVENVDVDEPSDEAGNNSLSYEELVARRVEEFITKSQEYMRSSELSQKVAKWHEMIGPRLENLEKRKAFDIHAYGSQVIRECEASQKAEVPFREVIKGQKKEEISRFFLSTLMLANTGNVDISTSDDGDLGNVLHKKVSI